MAASSGSKPLVFIVVVNWNGRNDTIECLRSLRHISYPDARIVVVDNASSDGSVESIRREFPFVELLVNPENLRFAGGNNVGIRHALQGGADYVLLLNNDTIVDPEFLTELMKRTETDPGAGMVGAKIYYYGDFERIWFAGGKIEWWKGWISHIGLREEDKGQYDVAREVDYTTGCCLLAKRSAIETIGLLDDRFFMYGEDVDWCLRARRAGYRLVYEPRSKLWHKISVSSGGHLSWYKNWNKLKSLLRLMARYSKPYHWITIPFGMAFHIARGFLETITTRTPGSSSHVEQ